MGDAADDHSMENVNPQLEPDESFFSVGDRVALNKPDGDGHFITREYHGEVIAVEGPLKITVKWDDGEEETFTDVDLDLI